MALYHLLRCGWNHSQPGQALHRSYPSMFKIKSMTVMLNFDLVLVLDRSAAHSRTTCWTIPLVLGGIDFLLVHLHPTVFLQPRKYHRLRYDLVEISDSGCRYTRAYTCPRGRTTCVRSQRRSTWYAMLTQDLAFLGIPLCIRFLFFPSALFAG